MVDIFQPTLSNLSDLSTVLKIISEVAGRHNAYLLLGGDVPLLNSDAIAACILQKNFRGDTVCDVSKSASREHARPIIESYSELSSNIENVRFWDLHDLFCQDDICTIDKDGTILFLDKGHLTKSGSELMVQHFDEYLKTNIFFDE